MAGGCTRIWDLEKDVFELKTMLKSQNKKLSKLVNHLKPCNAVKEPKESTVCCSNPYIKCFKPDTLYHLGIDSATMDFHKTFGDVRFVCMGGTAQRMEQFANFIMKEIGLTLHAGAQLRDLAAGGKRFAMFKVGPVLCVSHGMGGPSISILLHELIKLMCHAKCQDPIFFRMGTCGGLGLDPGTVVITQQALNPHLENYHEVIIQGKSVKRSTQLDEKLAEDLKRLADRCDGYDTIIGKTMSTDDFYEGQSRLDGAFCEYTPEEKMNYLNKIKNQGVVNMEMESTVFAAMTHKACIRAAVVCVTLIDRLSSDQITAPCECLKLWETRPQQLVARYIRQDMYGTGEEEDSEDDETMPLEQAVDCRGVNAATSQEKSLSFRESHNKSKTYSKLEI